MAIALLLALCVAGYAGRWELARREIARKFPSVPHLTTAQLAAELGSPRAPLLLDIRTRAEFEVSHLAGARHVEPESDLSSLPVGKETPIVTYCSVGYRSAAFAARLQKAGYTHVRNLEGSIFQWANEGRSLVRDGRRTDKVHPYNRVWGRLLNPQYRADLPPTR